MVNPQKNVVLFLAQMYFFGTHRHCPVACTEMTKNKKIEILRAVHVVELSWASIVIIFSFKSLHLGFRALP